MKKKPVESDLVIPEKRIFCVVANTVQAPLDVVVVTNPLCKWSYEKLLITEDTKTIQQPAGRLIAQAAHVVSKVRVFMERGKPASLAMKFTVEPITTIILAARDSFELNHVWGLLHHAKIKTHAFIDSQQPDYGFDADHLPSFEVRTAIATEPVFPEEVLGILDYLPLWKPNLWDME
jgi:hypothetical protein